MSRLREIKRKMRGDLHREMSVAALYIPAPNADPVPCTVRVWRKREDPETGELPGYQGAATLVISEDRIRFQLSQIPSLRRGAVVSVEEGEAFRVDHTYEVDLGYQTARVLPLSAAEADGLPLPDDALPTVAPAPGVYSVFDLTGHGVYTHGGGTQNLLTDTPLQVANDAATTDETQKPADIETFYDGEFIVGRVGDGLGGEIRMTFTPSNDTATTASVWLQIGSGPNRAFETQIPINLGAGIAHKIRIPILAYNRTNWQTNGARVFIEADGPGVISGTQYLLHRLHKARP